MSQSLDPIYPAATVADIPAEWIAQVRGALKRDGQACRTASNYRRVPNQRLPQGSNLQEEPVIEVQSINTGEWMPLNLPTNSPRFASAADRDAVLELLVGKERL